MKGDFMLRTIAVLLLCAVTTYAASDKPAAGTSRFVCEPSWGGMRYDLATTPPLHLMVEDANGPPQVSRQPKYVRVLSCSEEEGCKIDRDAKGTMTFERSDGHGAAGSYEVTRKDGAKQTGRFVSAPAKQPRMMICE
jgi:hypothetical protein